jgi:hypothetical protein
MLVIFTFSMTPKTCWHECLSDHGNVVTANPDGKITVGKTGQDCLCDERVVNTPFTEIPSELHLPSFTAYEEFSDPPYRFIFYITHAAKDLRGPPAKV